MTRLQIVTLPTLTVGSMSVPEYLIVLDEVDDKLVAELIEQAPGIKESTGARGVLAFESTIEVVHESSQAATIDGMHHALERLNATILERDAMIATDDTELQAKDATIERLNAEAVEIGVLVADLQTGLSEANQALFNRLLR